MLKYVLVYGTVAVEKNRVLSWKAACGYEWRVCACACVSISVKIALGWFGKHAFRCDNGPCSPSCMGMLANRWAFQRAGRGGWRGVEQPRLLVRSTATPRRENPLLHAEVNLVLVPMKH